MFALTLAALGFALAQGAGGAPHSYKLNRPLVRDVDGDVLEARASPGGTRVVYRANPTTTGAELFSAPADGSGPVVQLSDHATQTTSFRISADGALVVYVSEQLYSVPIDGAQVPVRISGSLGGGQIVSFALSPDSSRVVYELVAAGRHKLFSAPIDAAGGATMLNDTVTQGSGVQQYQISADSSAVLYRASATSADANLYRVPIDRSAPPLQLNPSLPSGRSVVGFELVPGDARVVYRARQDSSTLTELYVVPTAGGTALKLNDPPAEVGAAHVSADGARVVYLAGDLFSVPLTGGVPTFLASAPSADFQISPDSTRVAYRFLAGALDSIPIAGGTPHLLGGTVKQFAFSSDGARVLFRAGSSVDELFSVPAGGGTAVKLSPPTTAFGVSSFALDASSGRVAFLRAWVAPGLYELWSAPLDGAQPAVQLSPVAERSFGAQSFSVGAGHGFYVADFERDDVFQLYRVALDGSQAPLRLNAPFQPGSTVLGDVQEFLVAPRGGRVAYYADQQIDGTFESYAVRDDGGPVLKLGSAAASALRPMAMAPDGSFAILQGYGGPGFELYRAALDGSQPPLPLIHPATVAEGVWGPVLLDATGRHVVYGSIDGSLYAPGHLWTVPADGSAAPSALSPLAAGNGFEDSPEHVRLSADGSRAVFLFDVQSTTGADQFELYSAPSDGSQPAVRLHPALGSNAQVFHFALSPDSTRVVFNARLTPYPAPLALYCVPIDGSAAPTRISLPLANRDVLAGASTAAEEFQIAPDGRSVVYLAGSAGPGGKYELYAVPIDGSAGGVRLNGSLPPGGDALAFEPYYDSGRGFHIGGQFRIAPDSRHVAYVADQRVDEQFELFSAPLPEFHGNARDPERGRSLRIGGGGHIAGFVFTPDASAVVYLADVTIQGRYELFRVPIEGGASVRLCAGTDLYSGSSRAEFALTPDGSSVLFLADLAGRFELFDVPLDLAYPPRPINGPLQPNGDVYPGFRFSPDGQRVFYLADQDMDEVRELYGTSALHDRRASLR